MPKRWFTGVAAALFAAFVVAGTAQATLVFEAKNDPQADEENILLNNNDVGTTLTGTLNQSGALFNIIGNETLKSQANGQATVSAQDGSFTYLKIEPATNGTTFQDLILDIFLEGTGQQSGTVTFTAFLSGGGSVTSSPFSIDQGSNFFTIIASGGQSLVGLELNETGDDAIDQVRQIRISGVACVDGCPGPPVAEPGLLALLGTAMLGMIGFASRRRAQC